MSKDIPSIHEMTEDVHLGSGFRKDYTSRKNESVVRDDRKGGQHRSHYMGVIALDTAMSGWGCADGMSSYAVWAYNPDHWDGEKILEKAEARSDMEDASIIDLRDSLPNGHIHIYRIEDCRPFSNGCEI